MKSAGQVAKTKTQKLFQLTSFYIVKPNTTLQANARAHPYV